jgi:predicted nucleic acid-binding protein
MSSRTMTRIYVDTNVLINYCTGQSDDVQALKYVFSKRRKEVLFTSSLAVVQTITKLQSGSKPNNRKAFSREKTITMLNEILSKFTVIDLSFFDITTGFNFLNGDIEDNVHYVLSQKMKCDAILTNNRKDFVFFKDVSTIKSDLSYLKQKVQ